MMNETTIPVIVIDDTPIKRRGVCDFVAETTQLHLYAQTGDMASAMQLVGTISQEQEHNPQLENWLIFSDLHLGNGNGIELGRALLEIASGLRVVIYTQDPSWTLAAEIFRQEYTRRGTPRSTTRRGNKQQGLHGYALFSTIEPSYLDTIATTVVRRHETFIDPEVLNYLLKRLRGQRLTPRQEECAALIATGLSNDDIALRMGFLQPKGGSKYGAARKYCQRTLQFFRDRRRTQRPRSARSAGKGIRSIRGIAPGIAK